MRSDDSSQSDQSRASWHDYITLLGGSHQSGDIAAHLLAVSITALELPIVLHMLCTTSLVKPTLQARLNATDALELICSTFARDLVPLFADGRCNILIHDLYNCCVPFLK